MPFCPSCGKEVAAGMMFCSNCGAPMQTAATIGPAQSAPTAATMPVRGSLVNRMIRAAKLDASLYEEVEHDPGALNQAITVVLIASAASGIGNLLEALLRGRGFGVAAVGLVGGLILALIGWLVWSFVTYLVGTRVFGGQATYGELLRSIGFSNSPGVINVFGFIPLLGGLVRFVAFIWSLVAMIIALKQALDFTTGKAIATAIIGLIALIVVVVVLGLLVALPFFLLA